MFRSKCYTRKISHFFFFASGPPPYKCLWMIPNASYIKLVYGTAGWIAILFLATSRRVNSHSTVSYSPGRRVNSHFLFQTTSSAPYGHLYLILITSFESTWCTGTSDFHRVYSRFYLVNSGSLKKKENVNFLNFYCIIGIGNSSGVSVITELLNKICLTVFWYLMCVD